MSLTNFWLKVWWSFTEVVEDKIMSSRTHSSNCHHNEPLGKFHVNSHTHMHARTDARDWSNYLKMIYVNGMSLNILWQIRARLLNRVSLWAWHQRSYVIFCECRMVQRSFQRMFSFCWIIWISNWGSFKFDDCGIIIEFEI